MELQLFEVREKYLISKNKLVFILIFYFRFGTQGLQTGVTPQKAKKPVKKPEEGGLFDLFGGGGGDADEEEEEEGGFFDDLLGDDF